MTLSDEYLASHPTYVAQIANDVVGFYSLIVEPPTHRSIDGTDCSPPATVTLELDMFFVDTPFAGGGIGKKLFLHMKDTALGYDARGVLIISNPAAEAFYLAMGAERTGMEPPHGKITWPRPRLWLPLSRTSHGDAV
ncbi:GNAT family N-acetyltransferase [Pendulispora brunnea]|uniref:GNAT family N-acetyltransferase n=1 Tax=Pendulispora brunnea TaxID=2905690 RepID=A0ABZ2KC51_9BACT